MKTDRITFEKNLLELIAFASKKNIEIVWAYTPDLPVQNKLEPSKLEMCFGVKCANAMFLIPQIDI